MEPTLSTGPMDESAMVREQGGWVLVAAFANSALGFVFWAFAARLFTSDAVGIAGSLVSLSSLATSVGILGLDNGLVRFVPRADRPRALIRQLLLIAGALSAVAGLALSSAVLAISNAAAQQVLFLVTLAVVLTASQTWFQITDSGILAARRSQLLAFRAIGYGVVKIVVLFAVVGAGVSGLFGAYVIPLLVVVVVSLVIVDRLWPDRTGTGAPVHFRDVAKLSVGNWISGLAYSMPSRLGPSIMLIFLGASPVAFFFIALQLAEVLNYIPEAVAKSLFAHGSIQDRLPAALTSSMRRLLAVIMLPLVTLGVVLASLGMTIVGGSSYGAHGLALQLFLLATLPKVGIQLYKAQFNVDRRPVALIVMGSTLGLATLLFLVIFLIRGVPADWLPLAWVLGGTLALGVGWFLSRWRIPGKEEPETAAAEPTE
jgi:O-antigen/teichoic acid export membrane protein